MINLKDVIDKNIYVACVNEKNFYGKCFLYISASENSEDCPAIVVRCADDDYWIDENEIQSIEIVEES